MHTSRKIIYGLLCILLLVGCAGAKPKLCQDEDVKRRAGSMVGKIAQHADPGTKYYFVVIESNQINAFMDSRKNLVGLTTGLMNAMDDQELAFVVAHEVSHNTLGHYGKKVIASEATTTAFRVANVFIPGIGLLNLLVNPAVTNAFSREFELDADRKAAEIVLNAMNVPVEDSMAALLRIKAKHGESSTFILFASHPPIDDRVQNLATSFSVKTDPNEILAKKTLAKVSAGSEDKPSTAMGFVEYQSKIRKTFQINPDLLKGKKVVLADKINIYERPDTSEKILYTTNINESGTLTGNYVSGWWKVIITDKCEGWIQNDFIKQME
ncbi:MAG TPA: M48 family metalloprotease [Syntrophorhabdus sp.]|nr:M48 family metalloprotease [Syntrophorhabdus sp.]